MTSLMRWQRRRTVSKCSSGLNRLDGLNQCVCFNICNANVANCRKDISFKRAPDIVGIVLGHTGFLHIPPTFSYELESIGFSFKRTAKLFLLMFRWGDLFRQERETLPYSFWHRQA